MAPYETLQKIVDETYIAVGGIEAEDLDVVTHALEAREALIQDIEAEARRGTQLWQDGPRAEAIRAELVKAETAFRDKLSALKQRLMADSEGVRSEHKRLTQMQRIQKQYMNDASEMSGGALDVKK